MTGEAALKPVSGDPPADAGPDVGPELLAAIYQTLGGRRLGYDTMMWQVPVISFTAQAFLLTLALGGGPGVAPLVSAALALIIALMAMQLMSKHRSNEEIDSRLLEAFEASVKIESIIGCPPHARPEIRLRTVNSGVGAYKDVGRVGSPWFTRISSYRLWQRGLALFALTALGIIVANAIYLAGWNTSIAQWWSSLARLIP